MAMQKAETFRVDLLADHLGRHSAPDPSALS